MSTVFYSSKQQQSQHAVSGTVNRIQSALHRTWLKYRTILNNSVHLKPIQAAIGRQESTQNWKMSTQNIGRGLKTHLTLYNYTSVSLKLFLHVLIDTQIRSAVTKTKGKKTLQTFKKNLGVGRQERACSRGLRPPFNLDWSLKQVWKHPGSESKLVTDSCRGFRFHKDKATAHLQGRKSPQFSRVEHI